MWTRNLLVGLAATLLLACGARQRRVEERTTTRTVRVTSYGPPSTVVVVPDGTYYGQGPVVVVPQYEGGDILSAPVPEPVPEPPVAPPPPPVPQPEPTVVRGTPALRCSGNQRIRITDRHVVAEAGAPAIVATGNCVVEVSESIIRGAPAVFVADNARVTLVECRVFGDLVSGDHGRVATRGSAHERGRVLHARVHVRPG